MADRALTPRTPLDGYARTFAIRTFGTPTSGTLTLAEETGLALVSAAVPLGGDAAFAAALMRGFGAARPPTGESAPGESAPGVSAPGERPGLRILGMQPDLLFILFAPPDPDRAAETVAAALGPAAWVTDQSDGWAMLRIAGAGVRTALERLCMLDLDAAAFPEGRVARTVMEHLPAIVLRDGGDSFLLMSPRSSARSFLHAVERSIATLEQQGAEQGGAE